MPEHYDAVVVGTGQAGPGLAARLAGEGWKTAIIERRLFGGTCVNYGCIPTKAMVASARAAYLARRAADFGVVLDGPVGVDLRRVQARKDEIVHRSNQGLANWLKGLAGLEVIEGHARFTGPRTLQVAGRDLSADRVFLDVGARARIPDLPGLDRVDYLTNSGMLALDTLPDHLLVVGGSYIGLEFAQMFRRFGSLVTVVETGPRLVGREDPDVSDAVRGILEAEGVAVETDSRCVAVEPHQQGVALSLDCQGKPRRVAGSHLLLAVGRVPNTGDLGLEHAGVATDERGFIEVDDTLQTSAEGVWALGDVHGHGAFTHTSYDDFRIVAANLLEGQDRKLTDRIPCYALYIDPPLGRAGMTEQQVRQSGRPARMATLPMSRVGRANERSETRGLIKIVVDAETDRILGASVLGINGDEVIHCILDVMAADAPYTVLQQAVHIHPTVSELIPSMLDNLEPLGA